jgi:hypothetical protein
VPNATTLGGVAEYPADTEEPGRLADGVRELGRVLARAAAEHHAGRRWDAVWQASVSFGHADRFPDIRIEGDHALGVQVLDMVSVMA